MSRQVDVKALVSHILRGDGSDRCRICMGDTSDGQVYLGDTVMIDGDKAVTLSELLETITGIEVEEEPALPRGVCRTCFDDTLTAFHFRKLCGDSALLWQDTTSYLESLQEPKQDDKAFFVFYNDKEQAVVADQRSRVVSKQEALDKLNGEFLLKTRKPARVKRRKVIPCTCPDCGKRFISAELLNKHLRCSTKRACNICGTVKSKKRLAKHSALVHNVHLVNCTKCNENFENDELMLQHYVDTHETRYSCGICSQGFVNERALSAHMYSHNTFYCGSCNSSFENRKCYKHHESQCKKVARQVVNVFACDYCGVTYNKKPSLKIHIIHKHLNVLPFICQTCGKRTSTIGHLRSHEMTHKINRNIYECYCGAKLRTELGFELHQRIHSGEKPFECEECGDRFLSSSRRLDHIKRRHRGNEGMPYACEKCSSRFIRPCELKKHYLNVHGSVVEVVPFRGRV